VTRTIRIALVNDYEIVLAGLRSLLSNQAPNIRVVELDVRRRPVQPVDVTLLDTYGEVNKLGERIRSLASDRSNGAIVVFSFSDHPQAVRDALDAGAKGFISKAAPSRDIIDAVVAAAHHDQVVSIRRSRHTLIDDALHWPGREIGLTERESELLALLPTGMTNRELGDRLYVSDNTVKTQLRSLYRKLKVRNRAQAAALASQGFVGDHQMLIAPSDQPANSP
jgi:NarL family two-component system response regulator LiaR